MEGPLPPDPYKALGVAKDATLAEIRSAHRKLVLKCHPDKVQDPALKAEKQLEFEKVQQAYELLSDDSKRAKYDDQLNVWQLRQKSMSSAPPGTPLPVDSLIIVQWVERMHRVEKENMRGIGRRESRSYKVKSMGLTTSQYQTLAQNSISWQRLLPNQEAF